MKKKIYLYTFLIFGVILIMGCSSPEVKQGEVHEHAGFNVYLNGEKLNFSQEKYMNVHEDIRGEHVDMHDLNGEIIHKHSSGVTLGIFFDRSVFNSRSLRLFFSGSLF